MHSKYSPVAWVGSSPRCLWHALIARPWDLGQERCEVVGFLCHTLITQGPGGQGSRAWQGGLCAVNALQMSGSL